MGEQGPGRLDYRYGAAVVDLERMLARGREVAPELDEPLGGCTRIAIDRLVVVTNPEHGAIGAGQQPDEQEVSGGEVLELVDQEHPAGVSRRTTRRGGP